MPDVENGNVRIQGKGDDSDEEAAALKLWSVYLSEADKYDKVLVESWKSDMEGMLIFAGLFSASLTAFIIESYKTLAPSSGDSAVQLLAHISHQLAAAANGSTVPAAAPSSPFSPPATSLICNGLWFISLSLSLTCALIATLVEQWARDFLHRADKRSSPVIRARIFSYLYYGLKRFSMHTIVDIIPLILHASLAFFFAGFVPFLLPINIAIAGLAVVILAVVVGVYLSLTLLPILHLDCPYRTPLTNACWRGLQNISMLWRGHHRPTDGLQGRDPTTLTIVEAMAQRAMEKSPARTVRDDRALMWTVKSLNDDAELQPFVEAIPDVLWGPGERRHAYTPHIERLLNNPELHLAARIESLLRSCDNGLLPIEDSRRRRVICFKAMWAIASLSSVPQSRKHPTSTVSHFSSGPIHRFMFDAQHDTRPYAISVHALLQWSTFCDMTYGLALYQASAHTRLNRNLNPNEHPPVSSLLGSTDKI
ncbi:hypothetical protein K438DRAFT_1690661 [Mycena galopus ATCC 62051]|nr:hypothetical protein K438DRAFT_1690661 [Mycena galopus ATCC 62051]